MLGAPPAFVLSQDQTLYKWYLITYKVLNLCNFSDTIACVLSNYLFLELFIVFFPNTFKVPQVSVLFNFQGPVPTVSRGQLIYYISLSSVCQELFWRFFELSGRLAGAVLRQLFDFTSFRSFCQDLFEIFLSGFSVAHLPFLPSCPLRAVIQGPAEPVQLYYHGARAESRHFAPFFA